jgi:hypothetical protein
MNARLKAWELEEPRNLEAVVSGLEGGRWSLADGSQAALAASCLLEPRPGDRVAVFAAADGERFIMAVLVRAEPAATAVLRMPGEAVEILAGELSLIAGRRLTLASQGEAALLAPSSRLSLQAQDIFTTASGCLVETADQRVSQAQHWLAEVASLLRCHSGQALITAERDLRMDADRITMG